MKSARDLGKKVFVRLQFIDKRSFSIL